MVIAAIEDKKLLLEALESAIKKAEPECEVHTFRSGQEALDFAAENEVDAAFVDIRLPGMSGLELARKMKVIRPGVNIIFATGYGEYAVEAMEMHSSGYLMKPITPEKVRKELDDLRYPVEGMRGVKKRVFVRAFGSFEVFLDGEPVSFRHRKTKEYLAYLIDRGCVCTNGEIAAALWEKHVDDSNVRILRKDLMDTLRGSGVEDIIYLERNGQCVLEDRISCDYVDWKKGLPSGINAYRGEYMSQFSWAELTHAALEHSVLS